LRSDALVDPGGVECEIRHIYAMEAAIYRESVAF